MTIYSSIRDYSYSEQYSVQNSHPLKDVPGEIISHIYSFVKEDASIPLLSQAFNEAQNIQYERRFKKIEQEDPCLKVHIQRVKETRDLTLYNALKETAIVMQCNEQDYKVVESISNSSKQCLAMRKVIENQALLIFFEKTYKSYDEAFEGKRYTCPAKTCYTSIESTESLIEKASLIRVWMKENGIFLRCINSLTMKNQNLVFLPKEISLFENLKKLDLHNNPMCAFPKEIYTLNLENIIINSEKIDILSEGSKFPHTCTISEIDNTSVIDGNESSSDIFIDHEATQEYLDELVNKSQRQSYEQELASRDFHIIYLIKKIFKLFT